MTLKKSQSSGPEADTLILGLVPGVGVAPGQLLGLVLAGRLTALIHLKPVFSLRQLRSLELGLIFSSAITGGFLQFSDLARLGDAGKVELLTAHLGQSAVLYIWLMLLYGMFIPNTWQRAARVVGAIALVPVGVRLALRLHNPALSKLFSADQVSFNVLVLVVSGVSAIYGTHVINSLRQEAHQARKLGQYHLVARIGKGGMGEVWRASHKMLARPAAVKLIRPEMLGGQDSSEDATTLRRFEREARATAGLKSPHSIVIYDFGITDEGIFYYVMELLEGLDLESFVSRFGPVSPARAIHILAQSCDSLGDAHAAGLIHRDVKPANLYLCRLGLVSDFVKVLDFGLVKVQDEKELDETRLTKVGMTTGTPSYMSPQQVLGEAVDQRSDIKLPGVRRVLAGDRGNRLRGKQQRGGRHRPCQDHTGTPFYACRSGYPGRPGGGYPGLSKKGTRRAPGHRPGTQGASDGLPGLEWLESGDGC